jgi:hypothetical protein
LGGAAVEAEPARALCIALAVAWLKFQNVKVSEAQRSVAEFFRRMATIAGLGTPFVPSLGPNKKKEKADQS